MKSIRERNVSLEPLLEACFETRPDKGTIDQDIADGLRGVWKKRWILAAGAVVVIAAGLCLGRYVNNYQLAHPPTSGDMVAK